MPLVIPDSVVTFLTLFGGALIYSVTGYVSQKKPGEAFSAPKFLRAVIIGGFIGWLEYSQGVDLGTAAQLVATNTVYTAVADQIVIFAGHLYSGYYQAGSTPAVPAPSYIPIPTVSPANTAIVTPSTPTPAKPSLSSFTKYNPITQTYGA